MKVLLAVFTFCFLNNAKAQSYTSFFTGNSNDVSTNPTFGICLMGGASENDNAMQWFLNLADGGDVLVLRASGSDGYNNYMFNELGVSLNSVETIRIDLPDGATSPYVLQKISQAEAIWFAGGDQADYVNFFKNNAAGDLLNEHINEKQYPIGGISAGMAIMGEYYFDAMNGTVTSAEALNNPFDNAVSLGISDFLNHHLLQNTITDTHYDNPNREGRHLTFMARLQAITGERVFGIGLDEFTSACIDTNGIAQIFGDFPEFDDYAYFLQINCVENNTPENLTPNQSLDWNNSQSAVKVYKVPGNQNGSNTFNLNNWETGTGGQWQNWWVDQGVFQFSTSEPIDCETFSNTDFSNVEFNVYPNPSPEFINVEANIIITKAELYNITGENVKIQSYNNNKISLPMNDLVSGIYFLKIYFENQISKTIKVIKG